MVVERGADVGVAFDGDADRVMLVDAAGEIVDGDQIIALCARDRHDRGVLRGDSVVVTVMTNLGFRLAMEKAGITVIETAVGDRYVLEALEARGLALGGEQSGHVIFRDLGTTGDGLLTAVQALDVVVRAGRPLADVVGGAMTRLPQVLRNVRVAERDPAVVDRLATAHRRPRGPPRPRGPGAGPPQRDGTPGPRHGRGAQRGRGRRRRRRIGGRGRAGRAGPGPIRPPVDWPAMCGIIAVVRRPGPRQAPAPAQVVGPLHEAVAELAGDAPLAKSCALAAELVEAADGHLRGAEGVWALVHDRRLLAEVEGVCASLSATIGAIEARLDAGTGDAAGDEAVNMAVTRLKDAVWSVERDRTRTARAVADLAGSEPSWGATEGYTSVQQALSAIDRLEVRGRDSAGVHVLVRDHGLDLDSAAVTELLGGRTADLLFRSGEVRVVDGCLCFVYKAAAEIGELGDNTRALRDAIRADELLRLALGADEAVAVVLGHTRWASVGIICQPNAHPVDSAELGAEPAPYVIAALNGDVDNFADLKALDGLRSPPEITTDAKVIPTLVARRVAEGSDMAGAFRTTVASLEGSVAIGAAASAEPDKLLLALRGSGQALYVGLADDAYVVASEPYGVVEETTRYLRMDGETPANLDNPTASRGQIVVLDATRAGTVEGIERLSYDGTPLPVADDELAEAQITTRDIDRGSFPHFLLKEITESPDSFRKTLRGKLVDRDGGPAVKLPDETLPAGVAGRAARRRHPPGPGHRAGHRGGGRPGLAAALDQFCPDTGLTIEALPATELSGFGLRPDMADTLVVAISQSGTTTDTNRTVDLVRSRGAAVVAIVNRRGSDLTDKADGVLYTSDGRDVEMRVASTKAFYGQIAAGFLLAAAIAGRGGRPGRRRRCCGRCASCRRP